MIRRPLQEEIAAASDPRIVGKFLEAMQAAVEYTRNRRAFKNTDTIVARGIINRLQAIHNDLKSKGFDLTMDPRDIARRNHLRKIQQDVLDLVKKRQ